MGKYIAKRLLQFIVIMLIASVLIFVMVRLSKTDPIAAIIGGKQTTPEIIAELRAKFGLDKPLVVQYLTWIGGIFKGNLGMSFKYQSEIGPILAARMPVTMGLVIMASVFAMIIAIPFGVLSAVKKSGPVDKVVSIFTLIAAGSPPFLTALIFIVFLARFMPWYPFTGSYENFHEYMVRMAAPSIALSFTLIALACRITRSSMIEQMNAQYTQTAISKGVSKWRLVWKHNFRNAVIPVMSVVSIQIGSTIVGSVLVENVFSLSGLGTLLIDSVKASDYYVVQDITLFLVFIFMALSLIVDLLYAVIDPRIRLK